MALSVRSWKLSKVGQSSGDQKFIISSSCASESTVSRLHPPIRTGPTWVMARSPPQIFFHHFLTPTKWGRYMFSTCCNTYIHNITPYLIGVCRDQFFPLATNLTHLSLVISLKKLLFILQKAVSISNGQM
jgi:hypothetical protein